ncbi:Mitochondrial substrate carrier family protein isoform 1 [Hibiscus syriacus]|uniref:Mitochondrial substrate carrier family protein isoform 1 n=1 Tax=Hibiscus syriacus TaxID=106335 RepID=A0A6A2XQZ0_HIBSY|nr:Mitochondrial substrate carrier family protein isoform 1 [Hibiscus syriacus]
MDSDLEKNCTLDLSSNTERFTEIGFRRYRSASCKSIQCGSVEAEGNAELKRGHDNKRNGSFGCEPIVHPSGDGNDIVEKGTVWNLHKSLSAKMEASHSPSSSESDQFSGASTKARFSPIRKMFDPFMKSKYHPLHGGKLTSSPTWLSQVGSETKGSIFLVLLARQWKQDNAFNWAYTFHAVSNRKKSNAGMRRLSDSSRDSPVFAQMQVSCCFCSEIKDGGMIENSMVTEFVMYDIAHLRQRVSVQGSPDVCKSSICSSPGSDAGCCEPDNGSNAVRLKDHLNLASDSDEVESVNGSTPLLLANLHPNHEIAALVIQVPFKKRELEIQKRGQNRRQEKVKVVIPTGNHGFPSTETSGPHRYSIGGGTVEAVIVAAGTWLGAKENTPALTMSATEGGYAVDFHAKLFVLQAFSICVAILHGTETPTAAAEAQTQHLSKCDSLQSLLDDEVKFLIEAVTEEEEKKKVSKRAVAIPPTYVINPPPLSYCSCLDVSNRLV